MKKLNCSEIELKPILSSYFDIVQIFSAQKFNRLKVIAISFPILNFKSVFIKIINKMQ